MFGVQRCSRGEKLKYGCVYRSSLVHGGDCFFFALISFRAFAYNACILVYADKGLGLVVMGKHRVSWAAGRDRSIEVGKVGKVGKDQ